VSGLSQRSAARVTGPLSFHSLRRVLDRDLLEQSVAERLVVAAIAAGCLWLAIWWALS
jgi:hypothetical protein